jgi:hypothetical protein
LLTQNLTNGGNFYYLNPPGQEQQLGFIRTSIGWGEKPTKLNEIDWWD